MPNAREPLRQPRTVVVGAGFAGIEVARALGRAGLPVTIIDRQNHHLFQPLLYQVATAALSPADIAEPIRKMLGRYASVEVVLATVTAIDTQTRKVALANGMEVPFDILVLATGATHSYFGHEEWSGFAPGLKTIEDARRIRSRLLLTFEKAETSTDAAEQKRLMTIAVIGGGPTGVELAGSIVELARYTLARDFHHIRPQTATVLLLEAGPRILNAFPESLATYAQSKLTKLGVTVRTNCTVERIEDGAIIAGGETIGVGLAIWAAGVMASPLGKLLGIPTDRAGRIAVNRQLSVPGLKDIYALGDLALAPDEHGNPLPGLAQVAKQEGVYLGRALAKQLLQGTPAEPFVFHNRGNTAIIGRHAAVFDFGWWRLKGWFAWGFWALIHVYLLVGFEHRLMVAIQWLWRYLTYERGARLIAENVEN
ncbi:MAG TPA: NAD(P)/FAD-dependent oxidoreductase [Rhizomicrobium sp.]|jgi:NADH dehydrogenase|nr:NAD(P)/FAD-dependent oxidoreductase [Rhizomicrobium sp.]